MYLLPAIEHMLNVMLEALRKHRQQPRASKTLQISRETEK